MLTNENPFEVINKLIKNDKSDSNCFYHIIMAMTNLELDIEDLINLSDNLDDVHDVTLQQFTVIDKDGNKASIDQVVIY